MDAFKKMLESYPSKEERAEMDIFEKMSLAYDAKRAWEEAHPPIQYVCGDCGGKCVGPDLVGAKLVQVEPCDHCGSMNIVRSE